MAPPCKSLEKGTHMTAPVLILLAEGATNPRVVEVFHDLRKQMQLQRPELSVHLAFLDHCPQRAAGGFHARLEGP